MNLRFDGWRLLGSFEDDVGSWLLIQSGEALLLEVPLGLTVKHVKAELRAAGAKLRFITASHDHVDHLDKKAWAALARAFPEAEVIHPSTVVGDRLLHIGAEPIWLIKAPKHSLTDVVAVFRGVAMMGDIELFQLESVNDEVSVPMKKKSMMRLQSFQERARYHVHTTVSAHLNEVHCNVNWPELFSC